MKQNRIFTLILSAAVLLAGCTKEPINGGGGGLDLSKTALVELTTINMAGGETSQAVQSRAVGEYAMPVGSTFRLYAFEKGQTAIDKVLATRSYTIATTAGVAEKAAGEADLYLPLGEVDIYLVGPVSAYIGTNLYDIASENGVTPQRGIDLIASKTSVTITGSISLALNALEHKMTKAEVVVATDKSSVFENLELLKTTITGQAATGVFTFGENGGTITPTPGTDLHTMPAPMDITVDPALPTWSSTDYLIPQPEREYKIEVEFTCNQQATADVPTGPKTKYRQSGLVDKVTMAGGSYQQFTSTPRTPVDIIWRLKVLEWTDKAAGNVPTGNQDLVFDFRGTDAPIEIDGKKYWPDRSGNGNHALLNDNITYDPVNKCYYASKTGEGIVIPDLGADPFMAYTLETTMVSEPSPMSIPFMFKDASGNTSFKVHLPFSDNWICYDIGENSKVYRVDDKTSYAADVDYMRGLATWAFRRSQAPEQAILRNGVQLKNRITGEFQNLPFRNNAVLANGSKPSQKLYALRMYRSRKDDAFLAANAALDKRTYAGINTPDDYVQPGLMLDLRGDVAPVEYTNSSGRKFQVWTDLSGKDNHAEIIGTGITHDPTGKKYTFPQNKNDYLRLIGTLGKTNDFTLELIARGTSDATGTTLIYFTYTNANGQDPSRQVLVHYPWGANVVFNSPNSESQSMARGKPYDIMSNLQQWSFTRRHGVDKGTKIYENGALVVERTNSAPLKELSYCLIGAQVTPAGTGNFQPFGGEVQAVRFYNRALTEQEMRHNYMIDKEKYGLLK